MKIAGEIFFFYLRLIYYMTQARKQRIIWLKQDPVYSNAL